VERAIYVFAGYPGKGQTWGSLGMHAGGLSHCIENVENLGILERDKSIQVRKEGVFVVSPLGVAEQIADLKISISDRLDQEGITDNWFNDNWNFGNGVTTNLSAADYETKIVGHDNGRTLNEMLQTGHVLEMANLRLHQTHNRTEGWAKYERRWRASTCPQFTHVLHLTWLVTKLPLRGFAYQRLLDLIEEAAEPERLDQYSMEPGKHFSTTRRYDGKPVHVRLASALPMS